MNTQANSHADAQQIEIELDGRCLPVRHSETIRAIFKKHLQKRKGGDAATPAGRSAMAAKLNQKVVGLDTHVTYPCRLAPLYIEDREGSAVYRRSACMLLLEAIKELFPGAKAVVGQSLAGGYYFDMHGEAPPLPWALGVIEARMKEIVAEKRPFAVRSATGEEARRLFEAEGCQDKVKLLDSTRRPGILLVDCGAHSDICYGPFVPHAGFIEDFALVDMQPGFILQFPLAANSNETQNHAPDQALFQIHLETKAWNRILGVTNVGELNGACLSGEIGEVIKIAEGFQEKKVAGFAEDVFSKRDRLRLALIAGPSSSGKTTFSKRLMVQLRVCGLRPVALGTDNYFLNRENTPLDEDGNPDFECLGAVDTRLFNEHLEALLAGRAVEVPTFDFHAGKRGRRSIPMQLGGDDVLIVEGIHGLNPDLTRSVPPERKLKIYISALTQLTMDDHNRIMTTDVRLIRRIVRDRMFRGYSASRTISMWPSVLRGEKKNIFPFQGEADFMFNSSLVYEPAALRPYAERYLLEVPTDDDSFGEAYRLLDFVRMFAPIFPDEIPRTSILREFIGGSGFEY
jgi:uridine kinase